MVAGLVRRCVNGLSPLLIRVFSSTPGDACANGTPGGTVGSTADMTGLRAVAYQALNRLLEGSCIGHDVQLLVLPVELQEVVQELVPAGCITGEG